MITPKEIAEKILSSSIPYEVEVRELARAYLELEKKLSLEQQDRESEKREFKVFKDAAENEITKLKKSREGLRAACEFYGNGEHLNHKDHDIIELECEGSRMTDHIVGKTAREALKADDEIMKGK